MKHIILILLWLIGPVWAHGGEEHADLREAAAHEAATAPVGPPKVSVREFASGEDRFVVTFRQVPADPHLGDEVQVEANIKKQLATPDPLLGSEMTIEGAKIAVSLESPHAKTLGEAHAEEEPGTYGVHFFVDQGGQHRMVWTLQQEGAQATSFDYTFTVPRPLKRTIAWAIAALALGSMALLTIVRRRILWGGWMAALVVAAAALAYAYYPAAKDTAAPATPAAEAQAAQEPGLLIPLDLQRDLDMTIAPVEESAIPQTIRVPGTIRFPEGATHNLHARFPSRIVSPGPRVGSFFRKGEEILVLEEVLSTSDRASLRAQNIDLQTTQLEFATRQVELRQQMAELETQRQVALSELNQRQLDLSRGQQLYVIQAIPKKELQAARTAYEQAVAQVEGLKRQQGVLSNAPAAPNLPQPTALQQYSLVAPVNGSISRVEAAEGEVVEPSKVLGTLVDISRVWVEARVSEKDLAAARGASWARVTTVPYPGPFSGSFVSVAPALDPETRTASVFFEVNNADGKLLEGMSAEVEIAGGASRALTLPTGALQTYDNESRVFVRISQDRFEARTVRVIGTFEERAIVEGDISKGTPVVVQGAGALASEMARRAGQQPKAPSSSSSAPAPSASPTVSAHPDDGHTH